VLNWLKIQLQDSVIRNILRSEINVNFSNTCNFCIIGDFLLLKKFAKGNVICVNGHYNFKHIL
jgi:hypothetical protein